MFKIINIVFMLLIRDLALAAAPTDILILISSQDTTYHNRLSKNLRNDLIRQSQNLVLPVEQTIKVHIIHEVIKFPGNWNILHVIPHLLASRVELNSSFPNVALINNQTGWIVFCEESTHIELQLLLNEIAKEDHTKPVYLAQPLHDNEATIIHHFAFFENPKWFPYPMLRSGVIFSAVLLKRIAAVLTAGPGRRSGQSAVQRHGIEFSIDAAHELARFIFDNVKYDDESDTGNDVDVNVGGGADGSMEDENFNTIVNEQQSKKHNIDDDNIEDDKISLKAMPQKRFTSTQAPTPTPTPTAHIKFARKIILKRASFICPTAPKAALISQQQKKMKRYRNHKGSNGSAAKATSTCAMYAKPADASSCQAIKPDEIYFAIKTYHQFHKERVPLIEATWGQYIVHKKYFSDVMDTEIPITNTGVPNTKTGHCGKTLAILKLALKDIEQLNNHHRNHLKVRHEKQKQKQRQSMNAATTSSSFIRWIFLSDDDTLLSISRLCDLLGCFNASEQIYLGERYAYRLNAEDGFNYITGGAGIALSLPSVKLILRHCHCPKVTAPDDMILGSCMHMLQVQAIHTPKFHQARPNDYPKAILNLEPPITFHKFWQLDPVAVYERWFATADRRMVLNIAPQTLMAVNGLRSDAGLRDLKNVCNAFNNKSQQLKGLPFVYNTERNPSREEESNTLKHVNTKISQCPLSVLYPTNGKHIDL